MTCNTYNTQACLSCPHASMKCLAGPLMQPKIHGSEHINIMAPTKEAAKEPTEHPEGKPIIANAKTLIKKYHQATTPTTGTRCPTHHGGANKTLFTHSNPHTIGDANSAAITIRCMASGMREGEAQGWNDMRHLQHPGTLELPSRQHSMPGRPTHAAQNTRV